MSVAHPRSSFARLTAVLLALVCLITVPGRAATPVLEATIEPSLITMGQSAQLTVTTSGNNADAIQLPTVNGLQMHPVGQSRHIQIINGAMFSSTSVIVQVTPQSPGIYMIPGLSPQPLELRVNPEGSPGAAPPAANAFGNGKSQSSNEAGVHMNADGSAFVKLSLPKRDIYVGESVPVDIEIGLRQGFAQINGMPTLTGSDFTLNNLTHQPEQVAKIIDGKPYTVITWHSVLAAIKPGKFNLSVETPLQVRVRTAPQRESLLDDMLGDPFLQNMFGASVTKEMTLASPSTDLTVLELPTQGRPANFSGAVGQFKIADELSSTTAAAGDPLTLRLRISGTGNFDRVDTPMLDHVDQWKTYPPKSSFKAADALGNKGEKSFEQPIIAAKPGQQSLPPLTFTYFDPTTRKYETARSAALDVNITPALGESAMNAAPSTNASTSGPPGTPPSTAQDGLRPDHADTGTNATRNLLPLYLRPQFLAVPSLLALAIAAGWVMQRRRATPRPRRNRRARQAAQATERHLQALQATARAGHTAQFLAQAQNLLAETLAARWHLDVEHLTPAVLDARLDTDADADVRQLFALADEAQYSGHAPTHLDLDHWQNVVRRELNRETPPPPTSAAGTGTLALLVLAIGITSALLPIPPAAADSVAPTAIPSITPTPAIAATPTTATAYTATALYNQGNAYARAGKPGLAILNYQRARLLAPYDADLIANLTTVREAAHLPNDAPGIVARAATTLDPTLAAWLGVAGVALLGLSLLVLRRTAQRSTFVVGLILVGVTVAHGTALWKTAHAAVVLTAGTVARVSPVPMGDTLFVLAEGETVEVRAVHEDFLLINTRADRSGWVSRATVATVVPPTVSK